MSIIDEIDALSSSPVQKPAPLPVPELKDVAQEFQPMNPQWARFRDQFAEAMKGSFYTIDGMERAIGQGRAMFFPGKDSAVIGEIQTYEGGKRVFQVLWTVGDLAEIKNLSYGIESIARLSGCSEMLIEGRKGWERELKSLGYVPFSVTIRKVL